MFGGRYFDEFGWDGPAPTEWRRVMLSYPEGRDIRWRMLSDYRLGGVEPKVQSAGGMRTLRFEERAIEPLADEPMVPDDFIKWRVLQVSEFADWNQVARWADSLFPPVATVPEELQALLMKLSALPTSPERVAAATRWVQGEIWYFSLSFGESSHRPHAPEVVLQKRFGDCKDKTYLLLTLLRRLGVEATPMLVSLQAPRIPAKLLPSPWLFDHVVIQARVEGKTVYLDPTSHAQTAELFVIGQPPPWMQGLLASPQTAAPIVVADTVTRETTTVEVDERVTFAQLGAEGTLEVRRMTNQGIAEIIRMAWSLMPPEQRRQIALEDYEKRFPGNSARGRCPADRRPQAQPLRLQRQVHNPKIGAAVSGWLAHEVLGHRAEPSDQHATQLAAKVPAASDRLSDGAAPFTHRPMAFAGQRDRRPFDTNDGRQAVSR